MKRFVSVMLALAMLFSLCPAAMAEDMAIPAAEQNAAGGEAVQAEDKGQIEEIGDLNPTELDLEENEENAGENIELFSAENGFSTMANDEVSYSTNGSDWLSSTLLDAVTAIGSGTGTIKVKSNVTVSSEIKINGNITLVADGANVTIKRASTFVGKKDTSTYGSKDVYAHLFSVENGAMLTLGTSEESQNNLIIDGGAIWPDTYPDKNVNDGPHQSIANDKSTNSGLKSTGCLIVNDGTLNMYNGVVLQNNHNITEFDYAGTAVTNHKIFNMYGGKIWKNSSFSVDGSGGAVANGVEKKKVYNDAVFNMYGGEISYNAAGLGAAVTVGNTDVHTSAAKFTMSGGVITKNYTAGNGDDAGNIYINRNSVCEITGGKIIENEALSTEVGLGLGGAIYCCGTLNFSDGMIANNKADYAGDDIYIGSTYPTNTIGKVTLASKVDIDGKIYSAKYYFDGYKEGASAVRYSETNKDELTTLTDYSQESGLKVVYTELENYTLTLTCPAAKRHYIKVYVDGDEATGDTIEVTNQSTVKLVADQTAYDNGFYIWKVGSRSYSYNATNPDKNAGVEDYGTVTLTNISQNTNIEAIFRYTVTLTANPETAGEVIFKKYDFSSNRYVEDTEAGNTKVFQSESDVDFYQQPKDGYAFIEWKIYDSNTKEEIKNISVNDYVSGYGVYEIKAPERDITIEAVYQKIPTYTVTVTDPTYMIGSLGTIKVSGADDLAAVPAETELTLSIADENVAIEKHHSFAKWVVKTESNTEIEVTDNKFKMPSGNVTVTAEYKLNPRLFFYTAEEHGGREYETNVADWDGVSEAVYTILKPGMKAEDADSAIGTVSVKVEGLRKSYYYTSGGVAYYREKGLEAPTENIATITVNITDSNYVFNGIKEVSAGMGGRLTGKYQNNIDGNANKSTFVIPAGTYEDYKSNNPSVSIVLDIKLNALAITTNITNGNISGITSPAVIGSAVNFTLAPKDDTYELESYKVYKTGEESTTVNVTENGGTYSFTMPAYPVTVSANFVKKQHTATITVEPTEGGSVTIDKISPVTVGETVTVTATPNENWELSALTMNGEDISSTRSFTMPNADVVINATFVKSKFGVKVDIDKEHQAGGTVDCEENGKQVEWGTNIDFTVKPNQYYDIDKVLVNGEEKTPDESGKVSFDAAAKENVISATFKKKQFALTDKTAEADKAKGKVAIKENSQNVDGAKLDWGTRITVSVEPKEHWEIESVTIGGKDISEFENQQYETQTLALFAATPTTYNILVPTYDADLVVTYKKVQYTVSVNPTANGAINFVGASGGSITLDWDETVTFTVNPEAHYELDTLKVSGASGDVPYSYDSASGTYSFTMPTENVKISAAFKKVKYNLSMSGANVTFTPNGGSYEWGTEVTFRAEPDEWFEIKSVRAPGVNITDNGDGTYKFTMPQGNLTVSAVATRPIYNITFESQGGSAVGSATVLKGKTITKPTVPTWTNHGFAGWYLDSGCTQKYDFTTKVTSDVTLYARWFLWGDVNGDGKADSFDALQINRCYVKLNDLNNLAVPMAARVSGADKVRPDSFDALLINRHYVKYIDVYPVEVSAAGYEFDLENNTYIAK